MIKILLTLAVLGSVCSSAHLAMAQGQQGEASGSEISAQCAHRRVMAPNLRDDCVLRLRSDAQLGYGQGPLGYWLGQFGYWPGGANQQPDQRDEEQPEVRREQPKTSASPKVAAAPAPKAKKANTP